MSDEKITLLVVCSLSSITTANYLVKALQAHGYHIIVCSDYIKDASTIKVHGAVDVSNLCIEHNISPHLVMFVEGGSMRVLPVNLEKLNCISVWYGIDTHMDYEKHLNISRLFDVTFVAQKEYVEKLRADGIKQVHWLPLAFPTELLPQTHFKRDIDISYVGSNNVNMNPHRHNLLKALTENFRSTQFGLASPKQMGEIYTRSKIVFNKSVKNDINMRFFEAMGCGAVLITDPIINNGLEDLFEENKHYISYRTDDELVPKIQALLSNTDLLALVSQNAQTLILEKHTYLNRARTIVDTCTLASKVAFPKPTDYFTAFLSLRLYGAALKQCAIAFKNSSNYGVRKYISFAIALVLMPISKIVNLLEFLFNKVSK